MILEVIRLRKEYGPYRDLIDFLRKIDPKWLKFELIEPFIYAGAFDSFEYPRGVLIASLEGIIDNIKISGNNETLIKSLEPKYEVAPDLTLDTRLEKEEEFLGAYLSGHPVERFENVRFLKQAGYIKDLQSNQLAKIIGAVKSSRLIRTKKGEQMAFVVINDQSGECSITLFPKTYRQYAKYLEKNNILYIEGKAEEGLQEEKQLIVNKIEDASELSKKSSFDKLFIRVQTDKRKNRNVD